MRKIVDSNYLRNQRLLDYLMASDKNFAVLSDFVSMEAYKGSSLTSICNSMKIVSQFPNQIIILKNTENICELETKSNGLQYRMIDRQSTKGFSKFCNDLEKAMLGNTALQRSILQHGQAANIHMAHVLMDATTLLVKFKDVADSCFSPDDFICIKKKYYSVTLLDKIFQIAIYMSEEMFDIQNIKKPSNLINSFIFRYALSSISWMTTWIETGGGVNVKSDKTRNDMIDTNIAAYGLYFDGILSEDKKLLNTYKKAREWLDFFLERDAL